MATSRLAQVVKPVGQPSMEETVSRRTIGRFAASVGCGIVGLGLAVGGLLQLGVGLYNLAYPTAWQVSSRREDRGLGPPAIATPDTIWMSPTASNAQNLLVVSLASAAGVSLLVAAWLWLRGGLRRAAVVTSIGAALAGIFLMRLLSA